MTRSTNSSSTTTTARATRSWTPTPRRCAGAAPELTGLADEVEERTRELGSRGVGAGLPLRDVAVLLGVSHQRVAQVARRKGSPATDQRGAVSAATSAVIPK